MNTANSSEANTDAQCDSDSRPERGSVLRQAADRLSLRRKIRHINDRVARGLISFGGISVIITILLIFLYLFYEVVPLFESAELTQVAEYNITESSGSSTLYTAIEEQAEIAMHLDDAGLVTFFGFESGDKIIKIKFKALFKRFKTLLCN